MFKPSPIARKFGSCVKPTTTPRPNVPETTSGLRVKPVPRSTVRKPEGLWDAGLRRGSGVHAGFEPAIADGLNVLFLNAIFRGPAHAR